MTGKSISPAAALTTMHVVIGAGDFAEKQNEIFTNRPC